MIRRKSHKEPIKNILLDRLRLRKQDLECDLDSTDGFFLALGRETDTRAVSNGESVRTLLGTGIKLDSDNCIARIRVVEMRRCALISMVRLVYF